MKASRKRKIPPDVKRLLESEKEDATGDGNNAAMRKGVLSLPGTPGPELDPALEPQSALAPESAPDVEGAPADWRDTEMKEAGDYLFAG